MILQNFGSIFTRKIWNLGVLITHVLLLYCVPCKYHFLFLQLQKLSFIPLHISNTQRTLVVELDLKIQNCMLMKKFFFITSH